MDPRIPQRLAVIDQLLAATSNDPFGINDCAAPGRIWDASQKIMNLPVQENCWRE